MDDARGEYRRLLPEVPDIGGVQNVFQPVMTVNGWIVALHRAMNTHGRAPADAIRVCQEVFDQWLQKLPGFLLRLIGRLLFSAPARWYLEKQARRSQRRGYVDDFVWRVERGPGDEMSLVFDECAVNKFYEAQGVEELKPYCNFFDVTYSRLMGMGIDASETIGLGCDRCALRFQHNRETTIPPNLNEIIG
ncbi:MAG: L-2-amino-thiazoline-4-carboxylic acid hydrolase [Myxococcota bacterium]|nr:L-2-amino-thiazoline-4-carboxylic acid hydrolase [Myxococcota bacterium]